MTSHKSFLSQALEKLFKPTESIAMGTTTDYDILDYKTADALIDPPELFSINPIHPSRDYKENAPGARRADINVTAFRTFLFEMDFMPLVDQATIIPRLSLQPTVVTFSGSKSYHCLYSLLTDLPLEPHKLESIDSYKSYWRALQQKLDAEIVQMGVELPDNKESFFDPSCKNPSRYSRTPGATRDNGNEQTLIATNRFIFLEELPPPVEAFKPKYEVKPSKSGKLYLPVELKLMLDTPSAWGASEGLYPILFRLTLWAIDSTCAPYESLIHYMEQKTFPRLIELGYPEQRLYKAVQDAFRMKRAI